MRIEALQDPAFEPLLRAWFDAGLTRTAWGTAASSACPESVLELAARIYKRGLPGFEDSAGRRVPNADAQAQPTSTSALIPALRPATRAEVAALIDALPPDTFFIVDARFADHFAEWAALADRRPGWTAFLRPSEHEKTLATAIGILDAVPEATGRIFAAGGGITLDIAGFIAGLARKEISSLATTLLAAVDASIGGKTGVNFPPYGKNQVGLFVHVDTLWVAPEFFATLDEEQILCGLAEAAKHSWIFGTFERDEPDLNEILTHANETPAPTLARRAALDYSFKCAVVRADPKEKHVRKTLNLGHTLGHCLEGLSEEGLIAPALPALPALPHGIAVALGIKALLENGDLGAGPEGFSAFLDALLARASRAQRMKARVPGSALREAAARYLSADKKNEAGAAQGASFVLPPYGLLAPLLAGEGGGAPEPMARMDSVLRWIPHEVVSRDLLPRLVEF